MAGVTGVTGVTGLPEGDGRTLVCRWSTGIPASHLPPATCSSQRHANSKRANQTLCCLGLAKLPCTLCTVRTTHCTLGTHCTLHSIINCLPTWQAGWLAGTSPSPLTLSPLTTHHSLLPQPCRVIQVLFHHAAAVLLSRTPTSFSEHSLSILFFTLTREHSHLVVVSAPHIQRGHRNQPLSFFFCYCYC